MYGITANITCPAQNPGLNSHSPRAVSHYSENKQHMPPCIRMFKLNIGKFKRILKLLNIGLKIREEQLKVDMIFQSSLFKTKLIFVFEFSIQVLSIPLKYSNNQFEH